MKVGGNDPPFFCLGDVGLVRKLFKQPGQGFIAQGLQSERRVEDQKVTTGQTQAIGSGWLNAKVEPQFFAGQGLKPFE